MSFGLHNAALIAQLGPLTQHAGRSALSRPNPEALFHYTSESTAEKIIRSREIWATCLTEQSDVTELRCGIALAEQVAMELIDREPNPFVARVLSQLGDFVRSRREQVFITCFCASRHSKFHSERYGPVCFRFDVPSGWNPQFACRDQSAEVWYSPVVYKEKQQRKVLEIFLRGVSELLPRCANGLHGDGPRHGMAQFATRDIGQCLLTIVACFKREVWKNEEEWRLIVTPKLALGSSAPRSFDETFSAFVLDSPKRHVSLHRKQESFDLSSLANGAVFPPPLTVTEPPYDEVIRAKSPITQTPA